MQIRLIYINKAVTFYKNIVITLMNIVVIVKWQNSNYQCND